MSPKNRFRPMRIFQLRNDYCLLNVKKELFDAAKDAIEKGHIVRFREIDFDNIEVLTNFLDAYCALEEIKKITTPEQRESYLTRFYELVR